MNDGLNWAEVLALKKAAIVLNALAEKLGDSAKTETKCLVEVVSKAAVYFDTKNATKELSK